LFNLIKIFIIRINRGAKASKSGERVEGYGYYGTIIISIKENFVLYLKRCRPLRIESSGPPVRLSLRSATVALSYGLIELWGPADLTIYWNIKAASAGGAGPLRELLEVIS